MKSIRLALLLAQLLTIVVCQRAVRAQAKITLHKPPASSTNPEARVQATLLLPSSTTLPGAAVPLHLRLRNSGPALTLADVVQVRLTSPGGEQFVADWPGADIRHFGRLYVSEDASIVVASGGEVELVLPAEPLSISSWALDPRYLIQPGKWGLEVLLFEESNIENPVAVSSKAWLLVQTPEGRDAETWEAIRARDWQRAVDSVYPARTQSPYYPYLVGIVVKEDPLEKAALVREAVALHPDSPIVPALRFELAHLYRAASFNAFHIDQNIDKAVEYADVARRELRRLQAGGNAWASAKAADRLRDVPGREYFAALRREQK